MHFVLSPEVAATLPPEELGGKALGLVKLAASGAPVPPWRLIPASAAESARDDAGLAGALAEAFEALSAAPFSGVMARSSSVAEDQAHRSGAGQFHSELALTASALGEAVGRVWDSARGNAMAVVLQAAVPAEFAGVLFSAHPGAARLDEAYAEVVAGEGAALVQGEASPTSFSLDLATGCPIDLHAGQDGPQEFDAGICKALCEVLLEAEAVFETALDIEWCVAGGRLWIVQARPVTVLRAAPELRPAVCATSWFFDQRFLEPITPITWSALIPVIMRVALEEPLKMRGEPVPDPLYFRYAGQAYVAHEAHCRLLRPLPRWLLTPDLRQLFSGACTCARNLHGNALKLLSLMRYLREPLENVRAWERFRRELPARLLEVRAPDLFEVTAWFQAWARLSAISEEFLRVHRWSLVLADFTYHVHGLLLRPLPRPVRRRVWRWLTANLALPTHTANVMRAQMLAGNGDVAFFLHAFGDHSASLDYAAPTWRELHAAGRLGETAADSREERETLERARRSRYPLRRLLEMREEQRLEWEHVLARQRTLLLQAAELLQRRGQLQEAAEVFLMEWPELVATLRDGEDVPRQRLQLRRHQLCVERLLPRPFFVAGESSALAEAAHGEVLRGLGVSPGSSEGQAVFLANPAQEAALPDGPVILVVQALDPGHTHLLRRVQGVVAERGGLLSHAALLAREYGVPMVAGVTVEGAALHGRRVRLDGERGEVELLA